MKKVVSVICMICCLVMMSVVGVAEETATVTIVGKGTEALTDIIGETDFGDVISFTIYDANGEKVTYDGVLDVDRESETYLTQLTTEEAVAKVAEQGWSQANTAGSGAIKIIEQPAESELTENDLTLEWVSTVLTIKSAKEITADGTYTFEVTLDNGETATVSCAAKAFTTPVQLRITGTTCVEMGAPAYLKATWYDEFGVPKNATNSEDVTWTVEGAADYAWVKGATKYAIFAATDEAYAGTNIDVTLVDEVNGLTATHTVKIAAAGEKTLVWDKTDAVINEENAYTVTLMDADGDAVKLCCCSGTVEYVVISAPEGAEVTVSGNWKGTQGQSGNMVLVSDTAGEVVVQATVSFAMTDIEIDAEGNMVENEVGTMTYTTEQTFVVGE